MRRTGKADQQEAMVRIGPTLAIPSILRSLGADPSEVIGEAGLDPKLFDDPDNLISYAARSALIALCVAETGCSHFGLLIGQQGGLRSFGLVGLLVKHSPDVGSALRNFVRHLHLQAQGAVPIHEVHGKLATLGYAIYHPDTQAADQIADAALAIAYNILRELCGPEWKPTEVRIAHREPSSAGPFRRAFRAPLRFDAEVNELVFPAYWLERPVAGAERELQQLLGKQIAALEARHRDDLPEQVRRVLRTALLTNHGKAEQVAALFSMHSRTLNRRLNAFGTSFQELVDEGRYAISRQMLEDSKMTVSQIAAMLDYADAGAFGRAFRRWSGATPTRWRADRNRVA